MVVDFVIFRVNVENNGVCVYICERENQKDTVRQRDIDRKGQKQRVSDECYFTLFGYIKNKIKPKDISKIKAVKYLNGI